MRRPQNSLFCKIYNPNEIAVSLAIGAPLTEAVEIDQIIELNSTAEWQHACAAAQPEQQLTMAEKLELLKTKEVKPDLSVATPEQQEILVDLLYRNMDLFAVK